VSSRAGGPHVLQWYNADEGDSCGQVRCAGDTQGQNQDALSDDGPRGEENHHWRHLHERNVPFSVLPDVYTQGLPRLMESTGKISLKVVRFSSGSNGKLAAIV